MVGQLTPKQRNELNYPTPSNPLNEKESVGARQRQSTFTPDQQAFLLKAYTESFANPSHFAKEIAAFKKALETADSSATNAKGGNFKGAEAFEFKRLLAVRANEIGRTGDNNALTLFAGKLASIEGNPTGANFGITAVQEALAARKPGEASTTATEPSTEPVKVPSAGDRVFATLASSLPALRAEAKEKAEAQGVQKFYATVESFIQTAQQDQAFVAAYNAAMKDKAGGQSFEELVQKQTVAKVFESINTFVQTEEGKKFTAIAAEIAAIYSTHQTFGAKPAQ